MAECRQNTHYTEQQYSLFASARIASMLPRYVYSLCVYAITLMNTRRSVGAIAR
jgi:hypothetical protein